MAELDIEASVSDIASDLGLGSGESDPDDAPPAEHEDPPADDETPPPAEDAPPEDQAPPADTPPPVRAAPKAWAKEQHEHWAKLDPKVQDYIELREKQVLDGLGQYSDKAKYADSIQKALQPYEPYIKANGIDAPRAVTALFEAHKNLAEGTPEKKAAYLAKVAKNYGIDLAKAAAGAAAAPVDEPAYARELRESVADLKRDKEERAAAEQQAFTERVANEITSFKDAKDEKGNLKHIYFEECGEDIAALIKGAGLTLTQAYEKAVYANPVTRAKELARLQTQSDAALRAKAKQEAEAARNGRSTNVNSKDTRRAATPSKTGKWEDTMVDTLREIKERGTAH